MKFFGVVLLSFLLMSCASHSHDHSHKSEHQPKFSELGKGKKVPFSPGHEMIMHVGPKDLPVKVSLSEIILEPNSMGAPPHIHQDEDEIFVILEGTVHFLSGEKEVVAKKGTVASLPRGHFHGFWNPTKKPARMALFIAPGHFEKFFYAVKKATEERKPKSPQEFGAIVGELAAQENVKIDMSKLPESGLKLLPPPKSK